jgi:hypothetical protein
VVYASPGKASRFSGYGYGYPEHGYAQPYGYYGGYYVAGAAPTVSAARERRGDRAGCGRHGSRDASPLLVHLAGLTRLLPGAGVADETRFGAAKVSTRVERGHWRGGEMLLAQ